MAAAHTTAQAPRAAVQLPPDGTMVAEFAGFSFQAAEHAAAAPGIVILTCRIAGRHHPAFVGEGGDMAAAVAAAADAFPDAVAQTDGLFVLERSSPRLRAAIVRDLVGAYDPPLNTDHRKGPAAAELCALMADRADPRLQAGAGQQLAAPLAVTEDDLGRLVREFYAAAGADPLLGPVFARAVPDWESHYQVVQNFWSRTLLGTARYSGMPFAVHTMLQLRPEHFDRWVALFRQTAERVLEPVAAARAIAKVEHMSTCFQAGLFPPVGGDRRPPA